MKCRRSWQAAARDEGRLSDADAASFERHTTRCAECRRESSLAATIARAVPVPLTPLEHQRARGRLLAAANTQQTTERPRVALAALGVVFVAAAIALFVRRPPPPRPAIVALAPSPPPPPTTATPPAEPPPAVSSAAVIVAAPPRPHAAAPSAGTAFDEAFATFERGAYGVADVKFERFIRDFPTDPRAEDAAYLRAVARSRLGDRDGAAELARAYLDAYPHGFRRLEAERLTN